MLHPNVRSLKPHCAGWEFMIDVDFQARRYLGADPLLSPDLAETIPVQV